MEKGLEKIIVCYACHEEMTRNEIDRHLKTWGKISHECNNIKRGFLLNDKNNKAIFLGDKFTFEYMQELHKTVKLTGSFSWNADDLCFEIDVHDNEEYVCLHYVGNGIFRNFELIDKN